MNGELNRTANGKWNETVNGELNRITNGKPNETANGKSNETVNGEVNRITNGKLNGTANEEANGTVSGQLARFVKNERKSATTTIITFAQQVVANDNANDRCHRQRLFSDREMRTDEKTAVDKECKSFAAAQQVATQIFKVILAIGRLIIAHPMRSGSDLRLQLGTRTKN